MRMLIILLLCLPVITFAAGGHGVHLEQVKVDLSDKGALQRGANTFVNYCLSCHSAAFMRYSRIGKDLGISDELLKERLIFDPDKKVGDLMTVAMSPEYAESVFGVAPPDLSVIARSRGADWLYTYFLSFYKDTSRPWGVNNIVFEDVGMPHVLWELQGLQKAVYKTEVTVDEEGHEHEHEVFSHFEKVREGKLTDEEYEVFVSDLVNFLVYLGEPSRLQRFAIGPWVLFYLVILLIAFYILKVEYWKDVH